MRDIEEIKQQIAKLQKQVEELEKKKENSKRWKPESPQAYWFVDVCGLTDCNNWLDDETDECLYLTHNCFKTQEEAEEHRKEIEIYFNFKNFIEKRTESLDWDNGNQNKYFCYCNNNIKKVEYRWNNMYITQGVIYASSEQILKDAIDYIGGEEVAKRYLFGIKE